MFIINRTLLLLTCLLLSVSTYGQDTALPRVLIIGDSVYRQPASDVAKELNSKAVVQYATVPSGVVLNTASALEHLDMLLGEGKWDVIHFNCGLGDLIYRAPNMKSFRVLSIEAGGVRATSPEQYEKNLRELVTRLKATGAKLIWASTTPIRHSRSNLFAMGSEVEYNAIAAKVMADQQVKVNDMYSYVTELIDMTRPAPHGFDPFFFDRQPLHPPILQRIAGVLDLE